jgi:hypothetical protein
MCRLIDGCDLDRAPRGVRRSSTLNWRQGDKIYLTAERTLRVLEVRDDDADQPPALVVDRHARPASAFGPHDDG